MDYSVWERTGSVKKRKREDIKVGLISNRDLKTKSGKIIYRIILAFLWICVFVCLLPPLWIITSAFKDVKEILQVPPTLIPRSFHPGKLIEAWKKFNFGRYYMNTIFLTTCVVSLHVLANGLVAYSMSRIKPKGYKIMFGLILAGFVLPSGVSLVPTYMTWMDFPLLHINFLNTYWPFIISACAAGGMTVMIFKTFFDNIPDALLKAAKLDGCTEVGIFFRIMVPVCKPIIVTMTLLGFNTHWSEFFGPYLYITEKSKWTVMLYAFKLTGLPVDDRMLVLTFAMIPPIIVFLFFQKHIMNGFTMSGIKE